MMMMHSVAVWSVHDLSARKPARSSLGLESTAVLIRSSISLVKTFAVEGEKLDPSPILAVAEVSLLRQLGDVALLPFLWHLVPVPDLL